MFRRKSQFRKRRTNRKRRSTVRKSRVHKHIFSETFQSSDVIINSDGTTTPGLSAQTHVASLPSIQQFAHYKALYGKYRILALHWTFIPVFGQAEANQGEYNLGVGGPADRNMLIHYRRTWNGYNSPVPTNELAMLQLNGVKTRLVNGRPLRISMRYPTTERTYSDGAGNVTYEQKNVWCSFSDSSPPDHGQLTTYITTPSTGPLCQQGNSAYKSFCKVVFEVASPL